MTQSTTPAAVARLSEQEKQNYLNRALAAADWFVRTQLGQWRAGAHRGDNSLVWDDHYFTASAFEGFRDKNKTWEQDRGIAFNADRGRFLYYYHMPTGKHVPGLNWTMGRALFVLTEAYKITGDERYLESAVFGAKYVEGLCVTDPYYDQCLGAIRELNPVGVVSGMLDAAQAGSGLIMLYRVTGEENWLRLGRAWCDFILRHWTPQKRLPSKAVLWPEQRIDFGWADTCMHLCTTIPLWHMYRTTGEQKYLDPVIWAADKLLADHQLDNGVLTYRHKDRLDLDNPPGPNHHQGIGEGIEKFYLRNDDGTMVYLLAAWEATGDKRYLDAANANVGWIVSAPPVQPPYCVFPLQANNVLDVAAAGGDDHSTWVTDHIDTLLALQVTDSGDPKADGGFRGEDEQGDGGVFGGTSMEYVVTRVTCYSAGTLYRLSGKGTGAGFSVAGL